MSNVIVWASKTYVKKLLLALTLAGSCPWEGARRMALGC